MHLVFFFFLRASGSWKVFEKAAVAKAWLAVPLERFQKCTGYVLVLMEGALSRAEKAKL